jgi:hypothetical protein
MTYEKFENSRATTMSDAAIPDWSLAIVAQNVLKLRQDVWQPEKCAQVHQPTHSAACSGAVES